MIVIVVMEHVNDTSNDHIRNTKALSVMMDSSMINTADATKLTAFVQSNQEDFRGSHLSSTTCLTQAFFKSGEYNVANYGAPCQEEKQIKRTRPVLDK